MARLWSCGFELKSTASLMEWDTTTGSPSISTSIKRSGEAALRCNTTATTAYISHRFRADTIADVYVRFYLYIATAPSATTTISDYGDGSFQASKIRLRPDRKLEVTYNDLTVSGTGTTVLNTGQWYRIEYYYDETNNKVTLKIDGNTELNAVANNDVGGGGFVRFGVIDSATTDLYFDDIAVNDTSGSFQNSWPGPGSIVHLNPAAAGDNAGWTRAGTDSGANWSQANAVPPDDATKYLNRSSGQPIDDHKVQDPTTRGIGSSDTVTLVAVGVRGGSTSATANTGRNLNLRLKSASGGTLVTATSIDFSINGWTTHSDPTPRVYKLTSYTDPTTGSAWTVTGTNSLTNMQIGVQPSASSTTVVRYTEVWALVEYVPAGGTIVYGSASLSGTGSLTASGGVVVKGASNLSGVGTLSASGGVILFGNSNLSGYGNLTANGGLILFGASDLSGTGNLSATGGIIILGNASLSGGGTLTAAGNLILSGSSSLIGVGDLTANGVIILSGSAVLSGDGNLIANGGLIINGSASLVGVGILSADGGLLILGQTNLSGIGLLDVEGILILGGEANLYGVGDLTADGYLIGETTIEIQEIKPGSGVARKRKLSKEEEDALRRLEMRNQEVLQKREPLATAFINELKKQIMETGIVKNTHKPYHPRWNPRREVSERQAARVAYSIAKKQGFRVGKYRGPNKS